MLGVVPNQTLFLCKRLNGWRYNNLQIMTFIISDNLLYLKIDQDSDLSQLVFK